MQGRMDKRAISLLITPFNRTDILSKVGYSLDEEGFLIDESKNRVKAEDDSEINVKTDSNFALIGGSHIFVKNIAGYSQYLADKGDLRIKKQG